jgi:hypothetical protein
MQGQSFLGHPSCVIKIDAGGDATGKVGEGDAVVAAGVLVDQGNILAWLSQLDLGLPFDAFQRPDWQVAVWMGNGDAPSFHRVFKMASLLGDLFRAVSPQRHKTIFAMNKRPADQKWIKIHSNLSVASVSADTDQTAFGSLSR